VPDSTMLALILEQAQRAHQVQDRYLQGLRRVSMTFVADRISKNSEQNVQRREILELQCETVNPGFVPEGIVFWRRWRKTDNKPEQG